MSNSWMIVGGSKLNSEATKTKSLNRAQKQQWDEMTSSVLGIDPSVRLWKVAVADSWIRLMLAVKGLARVNDVAATPCIDNIGRESKGCRLNEVLLDTRDSYGRQVNSGQG